MALKSIPNPEKIDNPLSVDDVLKQIEEFESLNNTSAVVVKRQNLTLGVSYDILSSRDVIPYLGVWKDSEIYLKMWDKAYFTQLHNKYK